MNWVVAIVWGVIAGLLLKKLTYWSNRRRAEQQRKGIVPPWFRSYDTLERVANIACLVIGSLLIALVK